MTIDAVMGFQQVQLYDIMAAQQKRSILALLMQAGAPFVALHAQQEVAAARLCIACCLHTCFPPALSVQFALLLQVRGVTCGGSRTPGSLACAVAFVVCLLSGAAAAFAPNDILVLAASSNGHTHLVVRCAVLCAGRSGPANHLTQTAAVRCSLRRP